jgi:3',5'-cyclic AMP phosphodiesterase CpdA
MPSISRRNALKAALALPTVTTVLRLSGSSVAAAPYDDAVFMDGPPAKLKPGAFTIAVLPDTQNYSEKYPKTFQAQTQWIVDQRRERNISCVLHLGDITNKNSVPEWKNAATALNTLDGKLPYFLVPGNHDYSDGGRCTDRSTMLNDYFPVSKFKDLPTFGGVYDKEPQSMENSYHLFSVGKRKFLVLGLEFGPRKDVIRWANEVVARHKDREVILITHAYIYHDDTRYDWRKYGSKQKWNPHSYGVAKANDDDVNDGEELWQQLVSKHDNFIMTLNGHVLYDGLARTTTTTDGGADVHQLLVNFQMRPNGGDGWLRLLEFSADGKSVQTYDYSPTLDQHNKSAQNEFSLKLI